MPVSRNRTWSIVQLVRFRFRRIAGKDRVIPQLASRDQRAARRVVDRAGDASRVLPQLPTCTYFRYRLCVTDGFHFFVCLPIFRYKLWLRGVWGDPARSMLMELHSYNSYNGSSFGHPSQPMQKCESRTRCVENGAKMHIFE